MKLYYSPGACSLASHIVLAESGLPYEAVKVDLKTRTTEKGEPYAEITPKNQVPCLRLDDGQLMTEGVAIMQLVADKKPETNLIPKWGTPERYRAIEWLNYVATEVHKGLSAFFSIDRLVSNKEGNAEFRQSTKAAMEKKYAFLNEHLQKNQFLLGNQFTAPDAYLFTVTSWCDHVGLDLSKFTAVLGYMERVKNRPGVQKAMKEEGLLGSH
jgi:glutathione S-transferase